MKSIQIIILSLIILILVLLDTTELGALRPTILGVSIPALRVGFGIFAGLNIAAVMLAVGIELGRTQK